jgi:glycosyltransferase involved in cell wall biosynthesis
METFFNYIIPVFNKQDILPMTLEGINNCAAPESKIIIVIDGCTDNSEKIVDDFKVKKNRNVQKIYMPDVHMLRSVNAALKIVDPGFSVIMQDDIVLQEPNFEKKLTDLYKAMGPRLGVISLRMASNINSTSFFNRLRSRRLTPMIEEVDCIVKSGEPQSYPIGLNENFYPRMSAINGPNIVPWSVREKVGILDEALAPYGYDDPDYCLRAMKAGFINGIYPLNFRSDVEWGGTRRSKSYLNEVRKIHLRNRRYLWGKHGPYIKSLRGNTGCFSTNDPVVSLSEIPNFSNEINTMK